MRKWMNLTDTKTIKQREYESAITNKYAEIVNLPVVYQVLSPSCNQTNYPLKM